MQTIRALFFLLMLCAAAQAEDKTRHVVNSPGGTYEVEFRVLEHKQFSMPEQKKGSDFTPRIKYLLVFFDKEAKREVAQAEFTDVYGMAPDQRPLSMEEMAKEWVWSPSEDFVILAPEGWPSAPGTDPVKVVSLNKKLKWKSAVLQLDHGVWVDSLRVIGDVHNDCQYEIVMFDGFKGTAKTLKPAKSPVGYEIRASAHRALLIGKVLDNCRSEEDVKSFKAECFMLNLDTLKEKPAPCPAAERK